MAFGLVSRLHDAFVPFHWPGFDAGRLRSLPPGELRRYNLLWLGRGRSWLRVGGLIAVVAATVIVANRQLHPLIWVIAGNVVALGPTFLIVNHFESRIRERLIDREYPHLCRTCGYDLRGTPERCPECGGESGHRTRASADAG